MDTQNWMGEEPAAPAKNKAPGFIRENLRYIPFMLGIGALVCWGELSQRQVAERDALRWANLAALEVQQEVVQVDMTGVRLLGAVDSTGGKAPSMYRVWTALQAKDWMLLNAGQVNKLCAHVLGTFAERNKLVGSSIGPEALDVALTAMEGKTVSVGVFIPRFSAPPNGLQNCLGFAYDEGTRTLAVAGRTVALLANEQPGLTASTR